MVYQKKTLWELDLPTKGACTCTHIQMKLSSEDMQLISE